MAFSGTVTYRGAGTIFYSASSGDVGDTFVPAENDLIIVMGNHNNNNGDVSSVTAANWNITFYEVTGSPFGTDTRRLSLWIGRVGASPTSDRVTINRSLTSTSTHFVIQVSGASTTGTGLDAIEQISGTYQAYQGGGSPVTIDTLSAFQTDSLVMCFAIYLFTPCTWSTPTGYTSLLEANAENIVYNVNGDTTPNIAYASLPNYGVLNAIAIEILADGGGGGGGSSIVPILLQHNHFNGGVH